MAPTGGGGLPGIDGRPDGPTALPSTDCAIPDPRKRLDWLEPVGAALADTGGTLVVVGHDTKDRYRGARGIRPMGTVTDSELRGLMVDAASSSFRRRTKARVCRRSRP